MDLLCPHPDNIPCSGSLPHDCQPGSSLRLLHCPSRKPCHGILPMLHRPDGQFCPRTHPSAFISCSHGRYHRSTAVLRGTPDRTSFPVISSTTNLTP